LTKQSGQPDSKEYEHERLCETDTTSIKNKFSVAKSIKCNLKQCVCCF